MRIDPALYVEIEAWAQQEFRSVNGQIEFLLREAVTRRRGRHDPPAEPHDGGSRDNPSEGGTGSADAPGRTGPVKR